MIRFSALLVVVGIGLLIAGGVTSKLLLIYIAIGVSAVALLFLIVGAIVKRAELFGREPEGIEAGRAEHGGYADEVAATPEPAATAVGSTRSPGRDQAGIAGHGVAAAPDRPRAAAPFPDELVYRASGGAQPGRGFAGYEQFARDADRRGPGPSRGGRPSQPESPFTPQRPFVEPNPTRMDWAADLREAERQERERQGQAPGRPQRPGDGPDRAARPDQSRPDQSRPDQHRPDLHRPDGRRPDQGRSGQDQPQRPFVDPNPTRMDWAAGLREADQQERERQGQSPGQPGTRAEASRAEATRAEPVQARATRAEPVQARATRAEKVMAPRPDGDAAPRRSEPKTPEPKRPEQPAEASEVTGTRAEAADRADKPASSAASGSDRSEVQEAASSARDRSSTREDTAGSKQPAEPSAADHADSLGGDMESPAGDTDSLAEDAESPAGDSASPASAGQPAAAPAQSSSGDQAGPDAVPVEEKDPAPATAASDAGSGPGADDGADADQKVTVVPGVPRYHRSECILIRFMGASDLQQMPVEQAREAGCTPCRACQPDGEEDDD